jgi:hypothetical protein
MRPMAVFMLTCAAASAIAQAKLEPLAEPPPPPPLEGPDEPAVRIPVQESDKVEEIREGGRVVMLKVTPASGGKPYFLVDTAGNGNWMRRDPLDDGVRVPMWPVYTFE